MALLGLIHGSLMECQKKYEKITNSDSNFVPFFVIHHVVLDINFNGHCLVNNISILKN